MVVVAVDAGSSGGCRQYLATLQIAVLLVPSRAPSHRHRLVDSAGPVNVEVCAAESSRHPSCQQAQCVALWCSDARVRGHPCALQVLLGSQRCQGASSCLDSELRSSCRSGTTRKSSQQGVAKHVSRNTGCNHVQYLVHAARCRDHVQVTSFCCAAVRGPHGAMGMGKRVLTCGADVCSSCSKRCTCVPCGWLGMPVSTHSSVADAAVMLELQLLLETHPRPVPPHRVSFKPGASLLPHPSPQI